MSSSAIVVGAGLAGLAAADSLAAAGWTVRVLEARERVGGRVHSERLPNGALVELGGEFITEGYETTAALARRFAIALDGMGIGYPERELDPDPGLPPEAVAAAAATLERAAREDPRAPILEVMRRAIADDAARRVLELRLQSALAYPIAELDARFALKAPGLARSAETRRLRGGNQRLATELARGLGERLLLGCPAAAIHHDAAGVRVIAAGQELSAAACVITIPLSLLGELDLRPALPAETLRAIASTPVSSAAKLAVPLREGVVPRALMSAADRYWAWTTRCDEVGGRSVGSWAGAAPVLAELGVADGPERWLERLAGLWPQLELERADARLTDWRRDPWARGAYSVLPPVPSAAAEALRSRPAPSLLLAGEHTAEPGWSGTMEGALRSGLRAAAELLDGVRAS